MKKGSRVIPPDATVGEIEKRLGLKKGSFRNAGGRDTRSDKTLGKMRKENSK